MKNTKIKVENEYLTIKIPFSLINNSIPKKDWSILNKVKGIWKNKKIDALEYQIKIREEWK